MRNRATAIADKLGIDFALIHRKKDRNKQNAPERMEILVGDVRGKVAILVDDMIDTGETVALAATTLHENGAEAIFVLISHGLLQSQSPAVEKIGKLPIARLVVTNTLPQGHLLEHATSTDGGGADGDAPKVNGVNGVSKGVAGMLTVLDVSPLLAESIRRTHNGESISLLFGEWAERAAMAGNYGP